MAARKLQQEVDKCFKKVQEGVAEFDAIYEKIEQSNNPAQKEKLEDNLKREIKKLQRLRDQIKTWAAGNEIKDKGPLMEQRKLIETQMERFKAVEKAMKTKAYSKEGLSAGPKLDPKEQAKMEASDFLSTMLDEIEQQIETLEAEGEAIQATMKKGKSHGAKADRMAEIERVIERHKWHQGKLELIRRSLENGGLEPEQVTELDEGIRYYVQENQSDDFMEDDTMYDDLNLDDEEGTFGMNQDNDKVSSQDTQSIQDDLTETEGRSNSISGGGGGKSRAVPEPPAPTGRRPSTQLKSPLPSLATLHTPLPTINNNNNNNAANSSSSSSSMKPASVPTRPAGEGLKYASVVGAAAANDKSGLGIAPLPPPPGGVPPAAATAAAAGAPVGISPLPPAQRTTSATSSPNTAAIQPVSSLSAAASAQAEKASSAQPAPPPPPANISSVVAAPATKAETSSTKSSRAAGKAPATSSSAPAPAPEPPAPAAPVESSKAVHSNGITNGVKPSSVAEDEQEEESIYHLPAGLQDLVDSFEATKSRPVHTNSTAALRMMGNSQATRPDSSDAEAPRPYHPDQRFPSTAHYPQEPLSVLDDPRLYSRIDPDTLFYVFYYKQGSYQQYLAARALKDMSWRFHKQYQTWFQRHEEPKNITEEFEQGTYRFFDYESTWMNRRKADFKFAYKFLEDDV